MTNEDKTRKLFLLGVIVLGVLIVGGIMWAILAGPGPSDGSGSVESSLQFSDDNDPSIGASTSTAVVRIFGDLQCPACRAAEPGVEYAIKTYGDRVKFIWNDFPLTDVHPNAMAGAQAARCAEEQGKFWEFHDKLYSNQPEWAEHGVPTDSFTKYASELGLRADAFVGCVATKKYSNKINDDMAEGRSNNVQATPTFFVGQRRFEGGMTNDKWDLAIKTLLAHP